MTVSYGRLDAHQGSRLAAGRDHRPRRTVRLGVAASKMKMQALFGDSLTQFREF